MSLATVLSGVITTIRGHADYSTLNTFDQDWRHLNVGQARYVVASFGGLQSEELALGGIFDHNWTIGLDIYTLYRSDLVTTYKDANNNMQNVLDTLEADYTLSNTTGVHRVAVSGIGPIQPMNAQEGSVQYVLQQMQVVVSEEP